MERSKAQQARAAQRHRQGEQSERISKSDGGGVWLRRTARAEPVSPGPTRPAPSLSRQAPPVPPFSGWMKILEMDEKGTSTDEKCITWMNI